MIGQGKVERHSNSTVFTLDLVQVILNYRKCSALTLNPSPTRGEGLSKAFLPLSCLWERGCRARSDGVRAEQLQII